MTAARPLCKCHGEAMYRGGGWQCAVRRRAEVAARYVAKRDEILQQRRDRYDADAVYRIGKNLHDHARRRRQTIARKREELMTYGQVSE